MTGPHDDDGDMLLAALTFVLRCVRLFNAQSLSFSNHSPSFISRYIHSSYPPCDCSPPVGNYVLLVKVLGTHSSAHSFIRSLARRRRRAACFVSLVPFINSAKSYVIIQILHTTKIYSFASSTDRRFRSIMRSWRRK